MNFELTITGLCIVAMKSREARPEHPEAVDVVIPAAGMHYPRLTYEPGQYQATTSEPELINAPTGERIAAQPLQGSGSQGFFEFTFSNNPANTFTVPWGPEQTVPGSDEWLNWVPTLEDLGFGGFSLGDAGNVPNGASARITLPKGELASRGIVRDTNGNVLVWRFPAAKEGQGVERALANEIVFRGQVPDTLILNRGGQKFLTAVPGNQTLRLCISNDLENVPKNYPQGVKALEHLEHVADRLVQVNRPPFQPPTLVQAATKRTGRPICNPIVYVYS